MTPLRAVVLDFDGVIIESNALKTEAFAAVFGRFPEHAAHMMAYHDAHVSDSRFTKFEYLVTERLGRPADDPMVGELAAQFSAALRRRILECPAVPGAAAFIGAVSARLPVFLASVTPQDELEAIVSARGWTGSFASIYGCPPWTKVSAVTDIVARLGGPAGVLFVGDSAGDQRAARDTGVEFLARDSGLPFDEPPPDAVSDMTAALARVAPRLPERPMRIP
jgi:phosphoglycolate phosphatase